MPLKRSATGRLLHVAVAALMLAMPSSTADMPLRNAIEDLIQSQGSAYPRGAEFLHRLDASPSGPALEALRAEALLANPLLDFNALLLVKRRTVPGNLGLPQNWEGNCSLQGDQYEDELVVLSPVHPEGEMSTLYRHAHPAFIGDVDLHFDAKRLLFSSVNEAGRWRVFEVGLDGSGLRQVPQPQEADVDNYDACYLPNGNLLYGSTATATGVPCVRGGSHVANLFLWDSERNTIRRLTFDQDHNWCPTMLPDGRVLFLRWEYSDIPHFVSRMLFTMNPDGTEQMAYYGQDSYWPNAMFYARPIPGRTGQFVAIVGGHHGVRRMGELVLFDINKGRREAEGAIQRIPGYGKKVEAVLRDQLVDASWPKCLHPYPLSDKHFLVSMQPDAQSAWGLYLVDTFDNRVLIKSLPEHALLEPVPLRKTRRPPIIPERTVPGREDALVYVADIYTGPGLAGIPRGEVKKLRVYTYNFAFHGVGGQYNRVGLDGPWDIRQVLGTVPVYEDGSVLFRTSANVPIGVQPLDGEGKALQLMRSWMTPMPGEVLSCVGCHEPENSAAPSAPTLASRSDPSEITPFHGPLRGFSFRREVQPVLDAHCIACHDGATAAPDLRDAPAANVEVPNPDYTRDMAFPPSYTALRRYVRGHTMESDIHLLTPMEFHADTTRLVRLLEKGHQGVALDEESWERLITWIDMNTPCHGTWAEVPGFKGADMAQQAERRRTFMERYAQRTDESEHVFNPYSPPAVVQPPPALREAPQSDNLSLANWPDEPGGPATGQTRAIDLGGGIELELVRVPAGRFIMGGFGDGDGQPRQVTTIDQPFWMGRFEVTNAQFARFDPGHDSRLESGDFLQFTTAERGWPASAPDQPVCRVSWEQALSFCAWLREHTGLDFSLPTETQWEYACRAGSDTPMSYGALDADFTPWANLADVSLAAVEAANITYDLPHSAVPPWRPAITTLDDGYRVAAPVGAYRANPWGLHDLHGNVAEWTSSVYANQGAGRAATDKRVVRGGSWHDLPGEATASYRKAYRVYQRVFDVGFRVVCTDTRLAAAGGETS